MQATEMAGRTENGAGTPTMPATMRAVVQEQYGAPEDGLMGMRELPLPEIGADEVLVEVEAAGMGREVWHLTTGHPYPVRLAGYGLRRPKNPVPGADVAGRVAAVGTEVQEFAPGDEVFGIAEGSFAEYARAKASKLARKPESISFEQAAALPVSALAALQAVRDQAQVEDGQRVLIIGASGGVGSYAVQIAKARGAEVTGVASGAKADLVRSLGADRFVDYTKSGIADGGERYDVIIDTGGNRQLSELRRALTDRGVLVIVGGENGGRWLGGTDRQLRAMALSPFVSQKLGSFISSENGEDLIEISAMVDTGEIVPALDGVFELAEAPEVLRRLARGEIRGKAVLRV